MIDLYFSLAYFMGKHTTQPIFRQDIFGRLKEAHAFATCYDKTATSFLVG